MPDAYAHGHHSSVVASHARRGIDDSAAYLLPHLRDGMTLLDVGCGPGSITIEFAERFPGARVVGVDASAEVIALARDAATLRGVDNVAFAVGDVYDLSFVDDEFDVVHAHQVLQHLGRPVDALREMRRVSQGVVAARDVDYEGVTWYPPSAEIDAWMALYLRISRHNGAEPAAGRRLRSWFGEAGFARTDVTGSVWTYASDDDIGEWGRSWAVRALESTFATQARAYGFATDADLERIAAGWREFATRGDAWFQMPHAEVVAHV